MSHHASHPLTTRVHPLGFIQLDPLPTAGELEQYYSEVYYQESQAQYESVYTEEEKEWFRLDGKIADYLHKHTFRDMPSRSLFDVGCGEGFFSAELYSNDWTVKCCDFSSHGLTSFNPQLINFFQKGNIYNILEDALQSDAKYDLVNLSNVLEHVIDPVSLLRSLRKLLSEQGILRISVPNDFSAFQEYLRKIGKIESEYWLCPDHLSYFNFSNFKNLLINLGFEICYLMGDFPIEHFLLNDASNYKKLGSSIGKQAHYARCKHDLFYSSDLGDYVNFLEAQGSLGVGRDIIAYVR
jgi:2-polyprenyl-3-methyl-5-hydroxy-6-metoxy-1,4-benzoquinol methylase